MHSYRSRPVSPDSLTTGNWQHDESNFQSVSLLPAVYLVRLYVQKLGKNG